MEQEKAEKVTRILWLDLETTGLDHDDLRVLEAGWSATSLDLEHLHEPPIRSLVLNELGNMDDFVREMHTKNGLIEEVRASSWTMRNAEGALLMLMESQENSVPEGAEVQWVLGGAGVSTFDKRVIEKWFPRVHAKLTYWTYDVSVVRRFMRDICGITDSPDFKSEDHRVETDIALAIAEAQYWRDRIGQLQVAEQHWTDTAARYAQNADYWKGRAARAESIVRYVREYPGFVPSVTLMGEIKMVTDEPIIETAHLQAHIE